MKNVFEHIEHIKGKPHHIRKRVAFGVATAASALIGLVWFGISFATGTFAIQGSDFAMSANNQAASVTTVDASGNQQEVAGAAAATAVQSTDTSAHIEIVDTTPTAPATQDSDPTILPF